MAGIQRNGLRAFTKSTKTTMTTKKNTKKPNYSLCVLSWSSWLRGRREIAAGAWQWKLFEFLRT